MQWQIPDHLKPEMVGANSLPFRSCTYTLKPWTTSTKPCLMLHLNVVGDVQNVCNQKVQRQTKGSQSKKHTKCEEPLFVTVGRLAHLSFSSSSITWFIALFIQVSTETPICFSRSSRASAFSFIIYGDKNKGEILGSFKSMGLSPWGIGNVYQGCISISFILGQE